MTKTAIYRAKNFAIRLGTFRSPSGKESRKLIYVDQPEVVIAIPLLPDGRIVLIEQWRPLTGQVTLECPGGKVERGESVTDAIVRELSEEIGYRPAGLRFLGDFYSSVGTSTERIYCFVATDLATTARSPQDEIEISLRYFSPEDLRAKLRKSMFSDGKTQLALTSYFSFFCDSSH